MAKVMLVEDDNNLREIYQARLLAEGYEIVAAADGEEALAIAVKEKPDLIVADIMMPKISGFDMLDILRTTPETKNTKVVMMTALSQPEDKDRANKLGADRYLVKSQVTLEDLAAAVGEVLEGKTNRDTSPAIVAEAAKIPEPAKPSAEADAAAIASAADALAADLNKNVVPPTPPAPAAQADAVAPATDDQTTTAPSDDTPQDDGAIKPQIQTQAVHMAADNRPPAVAPANDAASQPAPDPLDENTDFLENPTISTSPDGPEADNAVMTPPANDAIKAKISASSSAVNKPPEPNPEDEPPVETQLESSGTPQPSVADDSKVSEGYGSSKKVIEPLHDPSKKPDLNDLLAKEEVAEKLTTPEAGAIPGSEEVRGEA